MSGQAPDSHSLSLDTKSFTFFSCVMFIKDFHVCQLAGTQALVFIFAQPKPYANPSFLLFVTLPTLGQENTKP